MERRWTIRLDAQAEWTNRAGDVRAIACGLAGHLCGDGVDLVQIRVEPVLLELVSSGAKRVGLNDVRAGANVFSVNLAHQIRTAEVQLVVATIDVNTLGLEHRAHGAVDNEDAIAGENFLKWLHLFNCGRLVPAAMKKPRAKQRGTSNRFEVFRVLIGARAV